MVGAEEDKSALCVFWSRANSEISWVGEVLLLLLFAIVVWILLL
jgi:hypothetical protein